MIGAAVGIVSLKTSLPVNHRIYVPVLSMDRFAAMKSLISVVESGSFSLAARQLGIGQPAISKSIAQLEKRLGVRLLVRSTRGLMSTEAGQRFYELARRAVAAAEDAEMAARGADSDLAGRLRVSVPAVFASVHIVPRLSVFLAAHPNLSLEIISDNRDSDLIEQGVDVAIRIGSLRDSSMTARKLATSGRFVLGSPLYFERAGIPRTPTELGKHDAIIYTLEGSGDTWTFRKGSVEMSVKTLGRLRVSAKESVRAAGTQRRRTCDCIGVGISSRTGNGRSASCSYRLDHANERHLGGFPDWTNDKCKSPQLCRFCRSRSRASAEI